MSDSYEFATHRRAGPRSGLPAGTERLRRVRLHGASESEWDMEGRCSSRPQGADVPKSDHRAYDLACWA